MPKALKYVIVGYVLLALGPALLYGFLWLSPLALILVVALLVLLARGRNWRDFGLSVLTDPERPLHARDARELRAELGEASLTKLSAQAERLEEEGHPIAAELPEDPLDNSLLVDILGTYIHEPAAEREQVEDEYRAYRKRFLAWAHDLTLLRSRLGGENADEEALAELQRERARLEAELAEIKDYVAGLSPRADEADSLPAKALEATARAGDLLDRARRTVEGLSSARAIPELKRELDEADAKRRQAWEALGEGNEQPHTALRLAGEVARLAAAAESRVRTLTRLPQEVERRLRELEEAGARAQRELVGVRDRFDAAARVYPPSCWHEVRGAGEAAAREIERARSLSQSAARRRSEAAEAASLEEAAQELDQAFAALDEASTLVQRIDEHLQRLEAASLEGRDRVLAAEKEVDRAWATLHERGALGDEAGGEDLLRRATELAGQARDELAKPQPDWLTVSDLAERTAELARRVQSRLGDEEERGPERQPAPAEPKETLEEARARAKEARDSAWALALVAREESVASRALMEKAEKAYQAALGAETTLGNGDAVVDAFREAERAAAAAGEAYAGEAYAPRGTNERARDGARLSVFLVWGAERR